MKNTWWKVLLVSSYLYLHLLLLCMFCLCIIEQFLCLLLLLHGLCCRLWSCSSWLCLCWSQFLFGITNGGLFLLTLFQSRVKMGRARILWNNWNICVQASVKTFWKEKEGKQLYKPTSGMGRSFNEYNFYHTILSCIIKDHKIIWS